MEISLLTDIDQILFIEGNIRGGVSYVNQRYCEKDDKTSLLYIDGKKLLRMLRDEYMSLILCFS